MPWILLMIAVSAGAVVGIYFWEKYGMMEDSLDESRTELKQLRTQAAALDLRAMNSMAQLKRAESQVVVAEKNAERKLREADLLAGQLRDIIGNGDGELVKSGDRLTLQLINKVPHR